MCSQNKMEDEEIVFDSDCENIEIVNEYNDVIGNIIGSLPSLDKGDSLLQIEFPPSPELLVNQNENVQNEIANEHDNVSTSGTYPTSLAVVESLNSSQIESQNSDLESTQNEAVSSDDDDDDDFELEYEMDSTENVDDIVTIPVVNYPGDIEHPDDFGDGWLWLERDSGPSTIPFSSYPGIQFDISGDKNKPEVYFNEFFDEEMWTTMSEQTNLYAHQKISEKRGNEDAISEMDSPQYKKHSRMHRWKDVNNSDMKVFMSHVIIMGMVRKPNVSKYWSKSECIATPFFGKFISQTLFENIMRNLHLADNTLDDHKDPLFKIRPFVEMCERNFLHKYKPGKNLSLDEACCLFKGRLKFRVYNKSKPAKFHIKLFQVCEAETGYAVGFEVYTGKDNSAVIKTSKPLDPQCTKTTKLVIGLLQNLNLLHRGHCVYMDNYYMSPQLAFELHAKDTLSAGTVRKNRLGLPAAVTIAKIKKGQSVFRRKDELLCLKWCDKRPVTLLSMIHEAVDVASVKKNRHGQVIVRPQVVDDYIKYMRGCDVSDQLLTLYNLQRRGVRCSRKLFFHFFSLVINNAYILYRKYGKVKMTHENFMEYIANYLLTSALPTATCVPKRRPKVKTNPTVSRLQGRHFPEHIPQDPNVKRSKPAKLCQACNFGKKELVKAGFPSWFLSQKNTCYRCKECDIFLCIEPCFRVYHTVVDYQKNLLKFRSEMA